MKTKLICSLALFFAASGLWANDNCTVGTGKANDITIITVHGFAADNGQCGIGEHCPLGLGTDANYLARQGIGKLCAVGHNAYKNPFTGGSQGGVIRTLAMLNKHCRTDQGKICRLVGNSMGGLITSGTISLYNQPVNGKTPYNILYSTQSVSAEGGSEYANLGDGIYSIPIFGVLAGWITDFFADLNGGGVEALATHYARGAFDHNTSHGTQLYHIPGHIGLEENFLTWAVQWVLPGQDDSVVAFHSACGYRRTGRFSQCMGETIRTGFFREHVTAWESHHMFIGVPNNGLAIGHEIKQEHFGNPSGGPEARSTAVQVVASPLETALANGFNQAVNAGKDQLKKIKPPKQPKVKKPKKPKAKKPKKANKKKKKRGWFRW